MSCGRIHLVYSNDSANDAVSPLTSGRADATLGSKFSRPLIDPQGRQKRYEIRWPEWSYSI